jgi:hypothetical protein
MKNIGNGNNMIMTPQLNSIAVIIALTSVLIFAMIGNFLFLY